MAELSILMRTLKRQRAEEKQNQRVEEGSFSTKNSMKVSRSNKSSDFGSESCCILKKKADNRQDFLCNSISSGRDYSSPLKLSSSSEVFQQKTVASRDVQTKLLQSLANSDDEDDDDDLLVRAAIFFEEKRKRELELSPSDNHRSLASVNTSRENDWYIKRIPPSKRREQEGRQDMSKIDDGNHSAGIMTKNLKDTSPIYYKAADKKAKILSNYDDDSESGEDRLEKYINQMEHTKRQTYDQLQHNHDTNKEGKIHWSKSVSSRKSHFQSPIADVFSEVSDEENGKTSLQRSVIKLPDRIGASPHDQSTWKPSETNKFDDGLWDDEIDRDMMNDNSVEKKVVRKPYRKKEEGITSKYYSCNRLEESGKHFERKARAHVLDSGVKTLLDLADMDDNELEQIYPEIENPRLGPPGPLVPLRLSGPKETESVYFVPPAINRYLADFQREGVQFLFSRLSMGMGAILADDMGMGKTIQTISLLAALLRKAGSGKDLRDIYLRKRQCLKESCRHRQNARDVMLLELGLYTPTITSQSATSWAPVLIVCPSSVIQQWINELNFWGHFDLDTWDQKTSDVVHEKLISGQIEILLVSKALLSLPENERLLKVPFKLVIVDEYHQYKAKKTQSRESLIKLKVNSHCQVIGLTGTPMQNDYNELFYLVDLCQPNLLHSLKEFNRYYMQPLKLARTKDAKQNVIELGQKRQKELTQTLKGVLLQRSKECFLKHFLKNKDDRVLFCELSEVQKEIYRHILALPDYFLLSTSSIPCDCGVNRDFFFKYKQMEALGRAAQLDYYRKNKKRVIPRKKCCYKAPWNHGVAPDIHPSAVLWRSQHHDCKLCDYCPSCILLPALQKLYKLCSHPILLQVEKNPEDCDDKDEREEIQAKLDFAKVAFTKSVLEVLPGGSYSRKDCIMSDHQHLSGKMRYLDLCLNMFKVNDRVLIFSYSTTTLTLIEQYVTSKGYSYLRLDGSTPTKQRQSLVDKFQSDNTIFLFLMSTKAGGLGLNLTAANKVIIFDVSWNPASDSQAQDRSYRIGQRKDVDVIRLVSQGTIEELIYARQIYKLHLKQQIEEEYADVKPARIFHGVQHDSTRKGELFGMENLLKFKDGSFIADLWSSKSKKRQTDQSKPIIHRGEEVTAALSGLSEEEVENLGGPEDCFIALHHSNDVNREGNCPNIHSTLKAAVQHSAFLREDGGEAVLNIGDNGFGEGIGQASQLAALACDVLCHDNINHAKPSSADLHSEADFESDPRSMGSKIKRGSDSIPMSTFGLSQNDPGVTLQEKAQKIVNFSSSRSELPGARISIMGRNVSKDELLRSQHDFLLPKYMRKSQKKIREG